MEAAVPDARLQACRLRNHKDDPHKPFWPLDWRDLVGYGFAALSLFVAAGGGIGGGGILVPLYILVLGARLVHPAALRTVARNLG